VASSRRNEAGQLVINDVENQTPHAILINKRKSVNLGAIIISMVVTALGCEVLDAVGIRWM
jgi:hypothetical protein